MTSLRTAALSVASVAGVLSLAACGSSPSPVAEQPSAPQTSQTSAPSVAPSNSPSPSPSPSAPATPTVLHYSGDGLVITVNNVGTALGATTPAFRAFIAKQLNEIWNGWGGPSCRASAQIGLTAYTSAGFAIVNDEGMFGSDRCANGGNAAVYAQVDGVWKEVIGTQEAFSCADLTKYRVPADLTSLTCTTPSGKLTAYTG